MNNKTTVKLLLDSQLDVMGAKPVRVMTYELYYPRIVHAELMTHRVFSRNASSSRAIPIKKMIENHCNFTPDNFRKNSDGMQPGEDFNKETQQKLKYKWKEARDLMIEKALEFQAEGVAKEQVNRLLETFSYIKVLVTSTEWNNFFHLRTNNDAQYEIREFANMMMNLKNSSNPVKRDFHIPYVDHVNNESIIEESVKVSVARCARVSYFTHQGQYTDLDKDLALYTKLIERSPSHSSPAEHQVFSYPYYMKELVKNQKLYPPYAPCKLHGNMRYGVVQYRKLLEQGMKKKKGIFI